MKKKFLQILALAAFVAVPATFVFAQEDTAAATAPAAPKKAKSKKPKLNATIVFYFLKPTPAEWHVNYPEKLTDADSISVSKVLTWANLVDSPRGVMVVNETVDIRTGLKFTEERPLKDVVKMEWKNDLALRRARNALVQGDAAKALAIAERFLLFFKDLKAVDGSLWLDAAVIKLDALDRQENDASLDSFIREIESAPGTDKVEGLPQRIKLVRLRQELRKGEYQRVFRDATDMLKTEDNPQTLAQLTMLKGRAEFNLGKYEDALYTFLRVPVFYGNQTEYVPSSKLEVARCLLKLDTPDRKAQNLPAVAESYIMEVITEYPMTPEAKSALELLPKDKQDALAKRDEFAEAEKTAAVTASITSNVEESSEGSGASSDDDDLSFEDDEEEDDDEE